MEMIAENLRIALNIAIKKRQEDEKRFSPTFESGFVTGLKSIVKAIDNGETIIIRK